MTDKELLMLCDEVLAEWEGPFHDHDGTPKSENAEAIVARACKELVRQRARLSQSWGPEQLDGSVFVPDRASNATDVPSEGDPYDAGDTPWSRRET